MVKSHNAEYTATLSTVGIDTTALSLKSVQERSAILTDCYLRALEEAEDNAELLEWVHEYYSFIWEQEANALLNETPIDLAINEIYKELEQRENSSAHTVLNYELLQHIANNKAELIKRNVIKPVHSSADCLCCGKAIKGLGLIDGNDAGTAICFNCIDTKHNYVGGGIYFANFD